MFAGVQAMRFSRRCRRLPNNTTRFSWFTNSYTRIARTSYFDRSFIANGPILNESSNSHGQALSCRNIRIALEAHIKKVQEDIQRPRHLTSTEELHCTTFNAEQRSNMSSSSNIRTSANSGLPDTSSAPEEQFEPRQTATSEDCEPTFEEYQVEVSEADTRG